MYLSKYIEKELPISICQSKPCLERSTTKSPKRRFDIILKDKTAIELKSSKRGVGGKNLERRLATWTRGKSNQTHKQFFLDRVIARDTDNENVTDFQWYFQSFKKSS